MAASGVHVSISAETIAQLGGFNITNSMFTGVLVSVLLLAFAYWFHTKKVKFKKIDRLQNLVEILIEGLFNLCKDIAGEKKARHFFPLVATLFIYILINNWFGLIPGVNTIVVNEPIQLAAINTAHAATEAASSHDQAVQVPILRAATADLNATIGLALISMVMVQYYGVKYLGASYFEKFFNFKNGPIFTFVGILELLSDISKVISFAFRLFGNIFAGEVLLVVIASLAAILVPVPFIGLEIFVGFVQALVFAMLTLVFINVATVSHEH